MRTSIIAPLIAVAMAASTGSHQVAAQSTATSAPLTDISYEVTFTRANAERRLVSSAMTFTVGGIAPVILSLPAWTPGAYEIANFARNISNFSAEEAGNSLNWDKLDPDTWRVSPRGAGEVTVRFDYQA